MDKASLPTVLILMKVTVALIFVRTEYLFHFSNPKFMKNIYKTDTVIKYTASYKHTTAWTTPKDLNINFELHELGYIFCMFITCITTINTLREIDNKRVKKILRIIRLPT